MNTIKLAKLLLKELDWTQDKLADECGISRQALSKMIGRSVGEQTKGFHFGVVSAALRNGFEAEAFSTILEYSGDIKISSVLRAVILYPDLKPDEHKKLLDAEEVTHMSPLPIEVIKSIIDSARS